LEPVSKPEIMVEALPNFKELFGVLQPLMDGAPAIEMHDEPAALSK
jgi:hypothetical protein